MGPDMQRRHACCIWKRMLKMEMLGMRRRGMSKIEVDGGVKDGCEGLHNFQENTGMEGDGDTFCCRKP